MNDNSFGSLVHVSQDIPGVLDEIDYVLTHRMEWTSLDIRADFLRLRKKVVEIRNDMYYFHPHSVPEQILVHNIESHFDDILKALNHVLSKKKS